MSKFNLSDLEVQILRALTDMETGGSATTITPHTRKEGGGSFSSSYVHLLCRAMATQKLVSISYRREGGNGRPQVIFRITPLGRHALDAALRERLANADS